jgi:hypothetical protein
MNQLFPRHTQDANVIRNDEGFQLNIPKARHLQYCLAQLDDYTPFRRKKFPHHNLDLSMAARVSANSLPGTWGFGVWNDPFGISPGFGGNPLRLPALPNAAWFFYASSHNYLSFRDDKPAHGFLAQTFCSPLIHPALVPAALALPFSRKTTRRMLSSVIAEDSLRLNVDVTRWHGYRLNWSPQQVVFEVDDTLMFKTFVSPNPPLGVVIWIDNQFAAFTPEGKIGFGMLENPEPAWLEIKDIQVLDS